jgi:signal transduction histidine kinase
MRLLVISDTGAKAESVTAIVVPDGYTVCHASTVEEGKAICGPEITKAVIICVDGADARLVDSVSILRAAGYRTVFAGVTARADEWEERALIAGAAFIFPIPWRAKLLLSRLASIETPTRSGEIVSMGPPPSIGAPRGSSSPFGAGDAAQWGSNPLLARLHEVAHLFRHVSQPDTFAAAYLDRIREALALNRIALYLAPEGLGKALECAYAAGIEPKRWKMATLSLDAGMGRWIAEHLVAISFGTIERYGIDSAIREEMAGLGAQCAIPVQSGDEFVGVLLIGSRVTGFPLTNDDIELVYLLALELGRTVKAGRLNKALAQERQFLSDLTEGLSSGCAVFDQDFEVLHVNRKLSEVCGGNHPVEFNFRSLPKGVASLVFEVSKGTRIDGETVFVDAGGGTHLAKIALFNPATRATLLLVDDISNLTAGHNRALISLERELVARLGAQFVHEVRNSLTRLMTMGQLLPGSRNDPAFLDQLQAVLPNDLHRLLRHATILEILSKPTPEEHSVVSIPSAIQTAWSSVLQEYPETETTYLEAKSIPEEAAVFVNAEVFARTCFELLLNAGQALDGKTSRRVEVSVVAETGSMYRITVEDNGDGFNPDTLGIAISPFVTTRNQGLGLGLTLAEKFARESGGSLVLGASRKLGGAAVALTLPDHG